MIKYIEFAVEFDRKKLQNEVALLQEKYWQLHYNTRNYEGGWSTIQLRSLNGDIGNNFSAHTGMLQGNQQYMDTPLLAQGSYLKEVIDFFEMEKLSVRLMKLDAGAIIKDHADHELSFEDGEVRLHIPVITNNAVAFYLQEEKLSMKEGSCWYLNLSLHHRVTNNGNTARIHLVIDGLVGEEMRAFFNLPTHKQLVTAADEPVKYSADDTMKIIEQLRAMNTETGDKLADDMEAQLNADTQHNAS